MQPLQRWCPLGRAAPCCCNLHGQVYGFGLSEEFLGDFMRRSGTQPVIATKFAPLPWRFTPGSVVGACRCGRRGQIWHAGAGALPLMPAPQRMHAAKNGAHAVPAEPASSGWACRRWASISSTGQARAPHPSRHASCPTSCSSACG
jgi:hypothetical protein